MEKCITIPNPVSFRLSNEALNIIIGHASDLSVAKGRDVDRTESLEDIVFNFGKREKTVFSKIRKRLQPHGDSTLDVFNAEKQEQLVHDQLQEALH